MDDLLTRITFDKDVLRGKPVWQCVRQRGSHVRTRQADLSGQRQTRAGVSLCDDI